jgi:hypothetical protein
VPRIFDEDGQRTLPSFRPLVQDDALMAGLDAAERTVQPAIEATASIALEIRTDPRRYAFSFDLAELEKTFEEPALIIVGRQDTVVGYRDAWTILESYPRATFAVVDRADPGWPLDTVDLLAALIDDWLARIAERST